MHPHILPVLPIQRVAISASSVSPAFYRLRDVMHITALSRSTIYRRIAEGRFPAPVHLGGRAAGWPRTSLQQWIDSPGDYRTSEDAS
jgi:prophage regulatory protein